MSINPNIGGPDPVSTIIRVGQWAADALNRGGGLSTADKAAIEAARQAGYVRERGGWRAPDGGRVTEKTVLERGRIEIVRNPQSVGYRPDLTESAADRLPKKQRQVAKTVLRTAEKVIKTAAKRAGPIGTLTGAIVAAEAIISGARTAYEAARTARTPAPPKPKIIKAWPEVVRPPTISPPVTVASPLPQPAPRPPSSPPVDVLAPPRITVPRLEVPSSSVPVTVASPMPGAPASGPAAGSGASRGLTRSEWIGLGLGGLGLLGLVPGGGRRRRRDPLTTDAPIFGLTPQPGANPLIPFYGGGAVGTAQCECPPKRRTRKPRKSREVCYSGTFVERASGLSKTRKRKIPCR